MSGFTPGPYVPSTKGRPPYEELQAMTESDLVAQYEVARLTNSAHDMQWFPDELVRRRADQATNAIVGLTNVSRKLTWVLVVLGFIGTAAAVIAALHS